MKKIGLICLALVLALGTLGVGYAMWSDTVIISGNVTTGSVDIEIESLSHTRVYKVVQAYGENSVGDIIFWHGATGLALDQGYESGNELLGPIASAITTIPDPQGAPQTVQMDFSNIFPTTTENITGDIVMHYVGSIPAHVSLTAPSYTIISGANLTAYMDVEWYSKPNGAGSWTGPVDPETLQLHYCDRIKLEINFDLPQDNDLMSANGTFAGTLTVQQWNE